MLPTPKRIPSFKTGLSHFQTFVWLRWRIRINQLRNGSSLGKALAAILLASFAMTCIGLVFIGISIGVFLPRSISSDYYFLIWDGFSALFCLLWVGRMATDIQRSDAITFDRILHLPVAFSQAFFINYISSLVNVTFLSLCGFGFGFILGSVFSVGPIALWIPIPFVFFLIAITALTYQFQGWLAALMSNPRRRQLVMILLPLTIVFVSQIPAILTTQFARNESDRSSAQVAPPPPIVVAPQNPPPENVEPNQEKANDKKAEASDKKIAEQEPSVEPEPTDSMQQEQIAKLNEESKRRETRALAREKNRAIWLGRVRTMNLVCPPLWLAGCVESIMAGTTHVLWLTGAMALIGFVSLRRNYQQTLRYFKGETDSRASMSSKRSVAQQSQVSMPRMKKVRMIEWRIPFVSEDTSAVITMTLQSMTRAPEVKLYLLLPFIVPFVLFGILKTWQLPNIDELKAAVIVGFTASSLFITSGMLGNCFAYDRSGFRAFVLSPIRRDQILLGRNLATIPFLLLQSVLLAIAIGFFFGMAVDKLFAAILLSASILPLYCLLTNLMSILTPFPLAAGSIQPKQFNLIPVLFSLLLSMLMPAITVVALLPLGLEWGMDQFVPSISAIPLAFLLSLPWVGASLWLYRWLLPWEGKLFAKREKELLRIVTSKIE